MTSHHRASHGRHTPVQVIRSTPRPGRRTVSVLVLTVLAVLAAGTSGASPAWACSCEPADLTRPPQAGDAVAIGRITGGPPSNVLATLGPDADEPSWDVTVEAVYRGRVATEIEVHTDRSSCAMPLAPGTTYLLTLERSWGRWTTAPCLGTFVLGPEGREILAAWDEPGVPLRSGVVAALLRPSGLLTSVAVLGAAGVAVAVARGRGRWASWWW